MRNWKDRSSRPGEEGRSPTGTGECSRCGRPLPLGSLKYLVTISVTADFDGVVAGGAGEEDLRRVLRAVDKREKEDLEDDVHQKMAYILCTACKNEFVRAPVGPVRRKGARPRGLIH